MFATVASDGGTIPPAHYGAAFYAAAWTLLLWFLLGSYLLIMWIIGAVLYLASRWRR